MGDGSVKDVTSAVALQSSSAYNVKGDYISGKGTTELINYFASSGTINISLPVFAVIDLETGVMTYMDEGVTSTPKPGLLDAVKQANQ